MRSFPHRPDADRLQAMIGPIRKHLAVPGDPLRRWRMGIAMACLDYALERPIADVAHSFREGLRDFTSALERGHEPDEGGLWTAWCVALACDPPSAHLLLAVQEPFVPDALAWMSCRRRAAAALFREDELEAKMHLGDLRAHVFDSEPRDAALVRNTCQLMEGAPLFAQRQEIRTASLREHGADSPLACIDLEGLAICRVRNARPPGDVCLPVELLDASP